MNVVREEEKEREKANAPEEGTLVTEPKSNSSEGNQIPSNSSNKSFAAFQTTNSFKRFVLH